MIDQRISIIAYSSLVLFIISIIAGVAGGLSLAVSIIWNALLALDIEYYKIPISIASNPFVTLSSIIDVVVFTLLAVWLASLFFEFIKGLGIRERLEQKKVKGLKNHVIITNMNRFGELMSEKLSDKGIRHVFIAQNQKEIERAEELHVLAIMGNPTIKETLVKAGIANASYVIACSDDDIKNSMIAISAKAVGNKAKIMTRVTSEEDIPKLSRSGIYKCVMPEIAAGDRMAESIIGAYS